MIDEIDKTDLKRPAFNFADIKRMALGAAGLIAAAVALTFFASEFGRRTPAQLPTADMNKTASIETKAVNTEAKSARVENKAANGDSLLEEVRRLPQNIYGYAGPAAGLAQKTAAVAKWTDDEWRVAFNAVNELRQKNGKNENNDKKGAAVRDSDVIWQPPEEIRGIKR